MKELICSLLLISMSAASGYAVDLSVLERSGIERIDEPVTCGVPLQEGFAGSVDQLVLSLDGEPLPSEFREVDYWPDGSLRWVHMDFQVSVPAGGQIDLSLDKGAQPAMESRLEVEQESGKVTVTTGKVKAEVLGPGFNVLNAVWLAGADKAYNSQLVAPHSRGLVLKTGGTEYTSSNDQSAQLVVESQGPMRVVLCAEGELASSSGSNVGFHYICRMYFYNNSLDN